MTLNDVMQTPPATPGADQGAPMQAQPNAADANATLATVTQMAPTHPQWICWTGQWPSATGPIASELVANHLGSFKDQRKVAQAYFDFFSEADPDLCDLNWDGAPLACILSIPEMCYIRVIYALGFPQNVLDPTAAMHFYCLSGNLENSSTVPFIKDCQFALPSKQMIKTKATNWPTTWPIWKVSKVSATAGGLSGDTMLIAPVPLYTVIDGLDHDLDAIELAERISSLDNAENEPYLQHALVLLTVSMVKYPAASRKPHVSSALLTARPTSALQEWAKRKIAALMPTITNPKALCHSNSTFTMCSSTTMLRCTTLGPYHLPFAVQTAGKGVLLCFGKFLSHILTPCPPGTKCHTEPDQWITLQQLNGIATVLPQTPTTVNAASQQESLRTTHQTIHALKPQHNTTSCKSKSSLDDLDHTVGTQTNIDNLIKLALSTEESIPLDIPVKNTIGKCRLMYPTRYALNHEAAPLLLGYAKHGCPVDCGANWSKDHIIDAIT